MFAGVQMLAALRSVLCRRASWHAHTHTRLCVYVAHVYIPHTHTPRHVQVNVCTHNIGRCTCKSSSAAMQCNRVLASAKPCCCCRSKQNDDEAAAAAAVDGNDVYENLMNFLRFNVAFADV